ncbi:MAG TPA: hypothetical protein VFT22_32710 [Kofleriaceae bacterium]|nr:hypothetical protein [Kofleriaceae bacterium]
MAGKPFPVIDVIDLTQVMGGVDKQTSAAQLAIAQATGAMDDMAKKLAPKDDSMTQLLLQIMSQRRSGSGPTPAPALPPTSTLTR